jgi:predicted Zn-dependent protease
MSILERFLAPGARPGIWPRAFACLFIGLSCAPHAEEGAVSAGSPQEAAQATPVMLDAPRGNAARTDDLRVVKGKTAVREPREAQIRELAHKVNAAIAHGDHALAETLLGALGRFLPEESLTMLRLRAWLDVSAGRDEAAREGYRRILERVEDDENAGINLAILASRAGEEEEAARILASLVRRHPDSARLEAVRQALGVVIGDPAGQGAFFRER